MHVIKISNISGPGISAVVPAHQHDAVTTPVSTSSSQPEHQQIGLASCRNIPLKHQDPGDTAGDNTKSKEIVAGHLQWDKDTC